MPANFAAAHGEPAPDGTGRLMGRGTALEQGASPGGAAHDRSAGDGVRDRVGAMAARDRGGTGRRPVVRGIRMRRTRQRL